MKPKKIVFLLLLLSITPFSRGCSYTHGFPLAVSCLQINCLRTSPWQIAIFVINILTACLTASLIIRKLKNLRWLASFFNALWINLILIWSYFFLLIANIPEPKQKFVSKILGAYAGFCNAYIIWDVPYFIYKKITLLIPCLITQENILLDFITRVWLITASLLLGVLLYKIKNARNKQTNP